MARRHRSRRGVRAEIAYLGARLLAEGNAADFQAAKRKAAEQLGVRTGADYPDNLEMQAALLEHQRVFEGEAHAQRQRALRECALAAMRFLEEFSPCLVGPVLYGSAREDSPVTLHVFSDEPEAVARKLMDGGRRIAQAEQRLRIDSDSHRSFPVYQVYWQETRFDVVVFPLNPTRLRPLSPLDGKPMQRASARKVMELLEQDPSRA